MRLTEKIKNGFYALKKGQEIYGEENGIRLVQIIGQLEDVEEELGIGLVTFFKALKGIYIKPNNIYVGSPYLCFAENENRELEFQFKVADTWYKVKDYGKTWALTKEEEL